MSVPTNRPSGAPEVYWWKLPDDEERLMALKPAELRCYLVVLRAIQQDKNAGLISERQVSKRARVTFRHAHSALVRLVKSGWLCRDGRPGATATYSLPHAWKGSNCIPLGNQLVSDAGVNRFPTGNQLTAATHPNCIPTGDQFDGDSAPQGNHHRFPTGDQDRFPTGNQHLDSLDPLEPSSSSTQQTGRSGQSAEASQPTTTTASDQVISKAILEPWPWSDVEFEEARADMREWANVTMLPPIGVTQRVLKHILNPADRKLWMSDLRDRRVRPRKSPPWGFLESDAEKWPAERADVQRQVEAQRTAMEAEAKSKAQADAAAVAESEAALQELQRQQEVDGLRVETVAKPQPKRHRCDRCNDTGLAAASEDARLVAFCGCDIGVERGKREPDLVAKDNDTRRRLLASLAEKTPEPSPTRTPRPGRERHLHGNRRVSR